LEKVNNFQYLGSILSNIGTIDKEIQNRVCFAYAAYGRLCHQVFANQNLHASTKLTVYHTVAISTLLYACETWTTYHHHLKPLSDSINGNSTNLSTSHERSKRQTLKSLSGPIQPASKQPSFNISFDGLAMLSECH